jgi:hypothetical protein
MSVFERPAAAAPKLGPETIGGEMAEGGEGRDQLAAIRAELPVEQIQRQLEGGG